LAVKRSGVTEERIALAPRRAEAGAPVERVCRELGIGPASFFRREERFGGMGAVELRRLRRLEEEDRELEPLVADLSLDKAMLQDVLSKRV
jgi:putative transposase